MIQMLQYNYKTGNSLRAWKEYCKNANVYGIDIFKEGLFEEPRIKTYVCDQSNPEQLNKLMDKLNVTMDLILDDGSHVIEHQVISFIALEKYLSIDGIYIIEDIWNKNFEIWKQLSCFSNDYQKYIKEKYDVFYYDQSSLRSNTSDCICIFKKKVHKLEQIQNNIKLKINELGNQSNKIQIKMLCNWTNSEQLCKEWSNMCSDPANFSWTSNSNINSKQLQLTWTNKREEIDYYVIINSPPQNEYYDPSRTIVFQMEPWVNNLNNNWGVKTWGDWAEPDPNKFLKVFSHKTHLNNVQWQINMPPTEINKSLNKISCVCSQKNFDDGHILRNKFIKYIETQAKNEEEESFINVFGQKNYHEFKSYIGPLKDDDKLNALVPYKYYFSAENNSESNYATEKIWEPILCETLCFYWGCPNLHEYIDPLAYVQLPLDNFEESLKIVKQAIEEDWWSQRIDIIKREKQKILNELGFFPSLNKLINIQNNSIPVIKYKYSAIIVEPRKHKALYFVLNNFLTNLSDDWAIIICHGNKNIDYLNNIIQHKLLHFKERITLINLNVDNLTIPDYNNLLTNKSFYDYIPTETFLIFQTDTMIFKQHKNLINKFLEYDYVGAPGANYSLYPESTGNGGLSLRKKSKMLEIINSVPYNNLQEDVYFSQSKINLYKPDFEKSKQFSIEQCFCEKSFGCHQPWHKPETNKIFDHYNEVYELYILNTFNNEIIITLTTIPSRLKYLYLTINSILSQPNVSIILVM